MSAQATRWAWAMRGLRSAQKFVLLALADRAGGDNTCWPSMPRLAEDTGLDVKTVRVSLRELVASELISGSEIQGRGHVYTLHLDKLTPTKNGTPTEIGTGTKNGPGPLPKTVGGGTKNGPGPLPKTVPESKRESIKNLKENQKSARYPTGFRPDGGTLVCKSDLAKEYRTRNELPAPYLSPYFLPVKSPEMSEVAYIKAANWQTWVDTYGEALCMACLKNAYRWSLDNAGESKTARGIHKFLGGWIARENDSPKALPHGPSRASPQQQASLTEKNMSAAARVLARRAQRDREVFENGMPQ